MNTTTSNRNPSKHNLVPFAFAAPAARQVALAGDFNQWDSEALPMRKGADGVWHLNVPLKPGRHEYRFVVDGDRITSYNVCYTKLLRVNFCSF